jgi:hypothetical protein
MTKDRCTRLLIHFENDFSVEFRAYDDAVAYRFATQKPGELIINQEEANFNTDHRPLATSSLCTSRLPSGVYCQL